jgi:starch synthase (maltosyl-transferring)
MWAVRGGSGDGGGAQGDPSRVRDTGRFPALVKRAKALGLEIALDVAFQCSPDHPYVKEHPEWFRKRPDGSIQYAENPPKKYQDIYPFDFETESWRPLWKELKSVFEFWIRQGITIFRVDNPHTKAFAFWEWCLGELKARHPELIFLSEAFTRPKVMYRLAKLGFTQSYNYFPWRNTEGRADEYLTELTRPAWRSIFGRTCGRTRRTFCRNPAGRGPAGVCLAVHPGGDVGGELRDVWAGVRVVREPAAAAGSGGVSDSEKYELKHWDLKAERSLES